MRDAVDKMDIYQFSGLVIVDDDMAPVGVITEGDVARAVSHRGNLTSMSEEPAMIYASKEPIIVAPDTEISDAFHRMLSSGLTILPVVDERRLAGVVFRVDLMQAMLMDVEPSQGGKGAEST